MKSLRIDFIEDQRWRYTWIATGVLLALLLIVYQTLAHQSAAQQNALRQQLDGLQSSWQANTAERPQDRRHAHALLIAKQLQTDHNKVFQALETLKEPGIRLRQLQIDGATGRVRVEYEFESLDKIAVISGHLNSGYTSPPWRFEGSSANSGSSRGSLPVIGNQLTTKGTWTCSIDSL